MMQYTKVCGCSVTKSEKLKTIARHCILLRHCLLLICGSRQTESRLAKCTLRMSRLGYLLIKECASRGSESKDNKFKIIKNVLTLYIFI